jgi:hypothetical protein
VTAEDCDQHYTAYDTTSPSYGLVCRETGHAVGLVHGASSDPQLADNNSDLGCMGTASASTSSHDRTVIDNTY